MPDCTSPSLLYQPPAPGRPAGVARFVTPLPDTGLCLTTRPLLCSYRVIESICIPLQTTSSLLKTYPLKIRPYLSTRLWEIYETQKEIYVRKNIPQFLYPSSGGGVEVGKKQSAPQDSDQQTSIMSPCEIVHVIYHCSILLSWQDVCLHDNRDVTLWTNPCHSEVTDDNRRITLEQRRVIPLIMSPSSLVYTGHQSGMNWVSVWCTLGINLIYNGYQWVWYTLGMSVSGVTVWYTLGISQVYTGYQSVWYTLGTSGSGIHWVFTTWSSKCTATLACDPWPSNINQPHKGRF